MEPVEGNSEDPAQPIPGRTYPRLKKSQNELLAYLFGAHHSTLAEPLAAWIAQSPRYAAFVEKNKDKIRKKLRVTHDQDAATDLLFELKIPYWLLQERRFEVAYEPHAAEKTSSPDYAVTFRTHYTFNIEATHLRGLPRPQAPIQAGDPASDARLVDVICGKLRQMIPRMANLLVVGSERDPGEPLDLPAHIAAHIAWIKKKAESSDPQFYARHRYRNPSDFFKHYERLSGILMVNPTQALRGELWLNPQARVKLAQAVKAILQKGFPLEDGSA